MRPAVLARDGEGLSLLLHRIGDGDREAEAEFVQQFQPGVRALVRRHCRPRDPNADDIVQDVLGGVLTRLRAREIHEAMALPAYIRTMIVRATTAEYRRRDRMLEGCETALDQLASSVLDPLGELQRRQLSELMGVVLAELRVTRDRRLLTLFYIEELSKEEVCAHLDIDPEHFHRVIFRARERLRVLILARGLEGTLG